MPLEANGYVKRSPPEIKEALVKDLQNNSPEWVVAAADVQNNILDAAIPAIMQFENLMADMINSFAPGNANDFMWEQLATSLNLQRQQKFQSQVELEFKGPKGLIVPQGTTISSEDDSFTFEIEENGVIDSTGVVRLTGYSDSEEVATPNSLTKINQVISDDLVVTNPTASLKFIPEETLAQLKERAQMKLRNPRKGAFDYAMFKLLSIQGVDRRLIQFRIIDYNIKTQENEIDIIKNIRGVEAIIGGGEVAEVALALFESFVETQKLISQPSGNEESRSVAFTLTFAGSPIVINFTRPKLLNLEITLSATFQNTSVTSESLDGMVRTYLTNYINNKRVGTSFNKNTLDKIIMNLLEKGGVVSENIVKLDYELKVNNEETRFDAKGYLSEVEYDCYLILTDLVCKISNTDAAAR